MSASRAETPVVLVHRAGGTADEWNEVLSFAREDEPRRVLFAVDLPGRRDPSDHPGSIEAMAELVADEVARLGRGPALLAGHSMGGVVAMQTCVDFPGWVRGLLLAASAAERGVAGKVIGSLEADADGAFAARALSPSLDGTRAQELLARMGRVPFSVLRADLAAAARSELSGRLEEVTVPVRVLVGRDDRLVPPLKAMRLRDRLADARLRLFDDVGHMMPWEAPRELAAEIVAMARRMDEE
jgi:pimeloyl-ACP methyl ester carboxylesterase